MVNSLNVSVHKLRGDGKVSLLQPQTLGSCNRSQCEPEQLQILTGLNAHCHKWAPNHEIMTTLAFKVTGKNNPYSLLSRGKLELEDL